MLAQLGADVILVEPPGGSPARRRPPFAGDARPGASPVALGLQPGQAIGGARPGQPRPGAAAGRPRRPAPTCCCGRACPAELPFDPDELAATHPAPGGRGPHALRAGRAEGRLADSDLTCLRPRLPAGADRRHRPAAAALGRPPGATLHGAADLAVGGAAGADGAPADPAAASSSTSPPRSPTCRRRSPTRSTRRGGTADRPLRRGHQHGHLQAALGLPGRRRRGQITLAVRRGVQGVHAQPLPLDLGGGRLRRGHPGQAVGGPQRCSSMSGEEPAVRDRPPRRRHRRVHRRRGRRPSSWPRPAGAGCCWPRWPRSAR